MASSSDGRRLSFSIGALSLSGERPRRSADVLHFLVVADASGRAARGICEPLAGRRAQAASIETLERLMQGWGARVCTPLLSALGEPYWFAPESLDDFHPDQLLRNAAPLAELTELRGALETDPSAVARLSVLLEAAPAGARRAGPASPAAGSADPLAPAGVDPSHSEEHGASESGTDMLARLLGGVPAAASPPLAAESRPLARPAAGKVDIDRFIRAIVDRAGGSEPSSLQPGSPSPGSPARPSAAALSAMASAAEAELGRRLRTLLATPALRALEATWRGIDGLCRHNPDSERVRVSVLDASFDELAANPAALAAVLEAVFVDPDAPSVVVLDHMASPAPAELRALVSLLDVCRECDVAMIAGAHPRLAGHEHFDEAGQPEDNGVELPDEARAAWAEVLAARERGARLALVLPRYLLRQPYGAAGEPIEAFPFEEILDNADHEAFSWGNGAYLLARALGLEHAGERGVHPDGSIDVRDLPVVYLEGGTSGDDESRIKPNAETWLSERSLGRLRAAGFSVLFGFRDTDRIRVYP